MTSQTETPDIVERLGDKAHCNDWYLRQQAAAEIERLRSELAKHQWRDISTKPPFVECEERGLYHDAGGGLFCFRPTHWQPLPSPPGENDG